jgi:hypothetical protein
MIDLRYILGMADALSDCAIRIKRGGQVSALAYIDEQLEMCRQAESELMIGMEEEYLDHCRRIV